MKVVLAVLALLAAAVALAATFVPAQAATVGGVGISQATLDGDLSTIVHSQDYRCFVGLTGSLTSLAAAGTAGATTGQKGGYTTAFADTWLEELIGDQLTATLVHQTGIPITAALTTMARAALERQITTELTKEQGVCGGTGKAVLDTLPAGFADTLVAATADKLALTFHVAGVSPSPTGLSAYYSANITNFDEVCVTLIEYRTATAAATVVTDIKAGTTTLHTAAATVEATTTGATEKAGSLCRDLSGGTPTPILGGAVGVLVGPVEGTNVYYVSEVTSRTNRPFSASVAGDVTTAIIAAGQTTVNAALRAELKATPVSIDPRYGTLDARGLVPPASPPAATVLTAAANQPSTAPG